jgi:hypothetical protein
LNNFVTGLVRRSAGLSLPSALRPAPRVTNIPPAPGAFEPPAVEPATGRTGDRDFPSIFPEPAPAHASVTSSVSPITSETGRVPQDRLMSKEERLPLQPRVEPLRQSIPSDGPTPALTRPPESSPLVIRQITQQSVWQEPVAKVRTPVEAGTSPDPIAKPASPQLPQPVEDFTPGPANLSPKPELPAAREADESSPVVTASPGRGSATEARNIAVRIGKVEIRSNQPASVVQAPRPTRNSGFDDLRLARTYLDRSAR